MSFEKLANAFLGGVNQNFGFGENASFNSKDELSYSQLGEFGNQIDKSQERNYLENGFLRGVRPKALEILMQEPDLTIVVKKRHFSSLVENYAPEKMSDEEKKYFIIVKKLFANKCREIAAYERLTKLEKVASAGVINNLFYPAVMASVDILSAAGVISDQTKQSFEQIRQVMSFSEPTNITDWSTYDIPYLFGSGEGTGTFELTMASSVNTTAGVEFGQGTGSITLENPYNLMIISEYDVEKAMSEVLSSNNQFFSSTEQILFDTIKQLESSLSKLRQQRQASNISFLVSENSIYYKKVRAIIDQEAAEIIFSYDPGFLGINFENFESIFSQGNSSSVDIDSSFLISNNNNGLNEKELILFNQIIQNYYVLIGVQFNKRNQIIEFNKQNSELRQRLLEEFAQKCIIQPMDEVSIFVGSKTSRDVRVNQGMNFSYDDNNMLSNINNSIFELNEGIDLMTTGYGKDDTFEELEKEVTVGKNFPSWLWAIMRNQFMRQAAGTHVFGGVVTSSSSSYAGGKYNVSIQMKDKTFYFENSQVNVKPSVDVIDSSLFDPLTPFKVSFNKTDGLLSGETPELLDENLQLLATSSTKFNSGKNKGLLVSQDNFVRNVEIFGGEVVNSAQIRNEFYDPDGFVYRWKRGIGTLVLDGTNNSSRFGTGSLQKETSISITNDIFAGQDVMNTLSLLITGQPYNFNNFLKAALNNNQIQRDDLNNNSFSNSFLRGLISDLNKSNYIWGNFIPFKKISLTDAGYSFMASGQFDLIERNSRLQNLLRRRAQIFDKLSKQFTNLSREPQFYKTEGGSSFASTGALDDFFTRTVTAISDQLIEIDLEIEEAQKDFAKKFDEVKAKSPGIQIIGDDISYDPGEADNSSASYDEQLKNKYDLKRRINRLTLRRLWQVKANTDKNYFIVDDSYDKNFDIKAFEESLISSGAIETFKSTMSSIAEKIRQIKSILKLEVFADTQGHIQVRPPGYNKIPSSVLAKIIDDRDKKGIKVFPEYLENLFFNQVKGLTDKVSIIEDQIRLRAAYLGFVDDSNIQLLLKSSVSSNFSDVTFRFLTDSSGVINSLNIANLLNSANPDLNEDANRKALSRLSDVVRSPLELKYNFDIGARSILFNSSVNELKYDVIISRVKEIETRFKYKSFNDPILKQNFQSVNSQRTQSDTLDLLNQISNLIKDRQKALKLLSNSIRNLEDGLLANTDEGLQAAQNPSLNKDKKLPEILINMIEDESIDDFGPNSGKRFVIKDSDIINLSITESPPPYTIVEVNGSIANNLVQNPSGLAVGEQGNLIATAKAADYDLWRWYGFKSQTSVSVPYLFDSQTQLAPLAVWYLNDARRRVFSASLTIRGNEYIQPGEVYYIESRDLLFYCESVSHSFTFGSTFTTTLTLTYGHQPGTFIPTMLDIIGKGLYVNSENANLIKNSRNVNPTDDVPLGAIIDNSFEQFNLSDSIIRLLGGQYGSYNKKVLDNIKASVYGKLIPSKFNQKLKIDIRVYYNKDVGFSSVNSDLLKLADQIKSYWKNPSQYIDKNSGAPEVISVDTSDSDNQQIIPDNEDIVVISQIDLSADNTGKSPSSAAWSSCRLLATNDVFGNNSTGFAQNAADFAKQLNNNLYTKVLDIFAIYEEVTTSGESSQVNEEPSSEESLARKERYIKNVNKRLGLK